jgi:trehalose synthase
MSHLEEVRVVPQPIERFTPLVGSSRVQEVRAAARLVRRILRGRVIWNVNSTAAGGGVAEMLRTLIGYARSSEIDTRWLVIRGDAEFFGITKRLHHALHGSSGDGSPLGREERGIYEAVLHDNAAELAGLVRPGDVALLHDPQTAGLVQPLRRVGAHVVWRCHIGTDHDNPEVQLGWDFLEPYLEDADCMVFSREAYRPSFCPPERSRIIPPSIDAFSPKNQKLDPTATRSILVHTGLVEGPNGPGSPTFLRDDGSPGRVDRHPEIVREGEAPRWDTPLVVQVSRWDSLKDPVGVLQGFARFVNGVAGGPAELVLAGPGVASVSDDPEQRSVWEQVVDTWHALPLAERRRVHLACLPMADVDENAAIVNALQRHASVVVQKSLQEGFGLTVTEAMWKGRPVVGSAVGGIQDQIEDGVQGVLLEDPSDLACFGRAIGELLADRPQAERMGSEGRERVRERFLGIRHLLAYAGLVKDVLG